LVVTFNPRVNVDLDIGQKDNVHVT